MNQDLTKNPKEFLNTLDGNKTFAEAVEILFEKFEVEHDKLSTDLAEIADELLQEGLLQTVHAS